MDQRKLDQIEYKAKETLRARLSQITYKYNKLKEWNEYLLTKKQDREIAKAHKRAEDRKKNQIRKLEGKKVKEKPKTEARYKTKADRYFSRVVRSIWAFQENGERYNYDYTWKIKVRIKDLTCGHFITRWVYTLRYDLNNCLPQTKWQNQAEHYNPSLKTQFRNILIATRTIEVVKTLEEIHNKRDRNENKKVIIKDEYEKRKEIYEQQYKWMRE